MDCSICGLFIAKRTNSMVQGQGTNSLLSSVQKGCFTCKILKDCIEQFFGPQYSFWFIVRQGSCGVTESHVTVEDAAQSHVDGIVIRQGHGTYLISATFL
jgi:hypothetical protein